MENHYQVFVSSTYADLRDERQEVVQALLELNCVPTGLDLFPDGDEDKWTLIKKVIDDCDFYLVIIAGRYGSIGPSGKSYTQMEYEYAVSRGKPVMGFLRANPDAIAPQTAEESEVGKAALESFRALAITRMCSFWSSPEELGGAVSRSIVRLIKTHPREYYYSVFISYSTKDQDFADRLHADLQARGVRCWFAPHNIQGGKKVHEQIHEAIRAYDKVLLVLSEHSMNSKWVKTEIANARSREEQQNRRILFPITLIPFDRIKAWTLFDADTGIDSAREIREYFVPDFSNWKDHDVYGTAFERLVRDLKSQPGGNLQP